MISGIQILGVIFCVVMLYLTYVNYKKKSFGYRSLILWFLVWASALVAVSVPQTMYGVMEALKVERTADFLVLLGFAFFATTTFYLFIIVKKNNDKLESLVRNLAIREVSEKNKDKFRKPRVK